MKICRQFVIFGPGKLQKGSLKVLEFFQGHGVRTLSEEYKKIAESNIRTSLEISLCLPFHEPKWKPLALKAGYFLRLISTTISVIKLCGISIWFGIVLQSNIKSRTISVPFLQMKLIGHSLRFCHLMYMLNRVNILYNVNSIEGRVLFLQILSSLCSMLSRKCKDLQLCMSLA